MFAELSIPTPDPILQTGAAFDADTRPDKVDLGIGIYRDAAGRTPVIQAVREAQQQLVAAETSKRYLTFAGEERFNTAMLELLLGDAVAPARRRAIQTPGGGGAVRLLSELILRARPQATVWVAKPTWINHQAIFDAVGLATRSYRHTDAASGRIDRQALHDALEHTRAGDVLVLHGCCHNPTGVDPTLDEWREIAQQCRERQLTPFVDIAYQGFGEGLTSDAAALRLLADAVPEVLVAASCSKNFGLYRDRVGCAAIVAANASVADAARAAMLSLAQVNWSFPPHHGAAIVAAVLESKELSQRWSDELEAMRRRLVHHRELLSKALRSSLPAVYAPWAESLCVQRGMFSLLPLAPEQVLALREAGGLYLPPDGRINIAGVTQANVAHIARHVAAALVLRPGSFATEG